MNLKINKLKSSNITGNISEIVDITNDVISKIKISETAGDEKHIKITDLKLKLNKGIVPAPGFYTMIAIYIDDELYNIYLLADYHLGTKLYWQAEEDEKTNIYIYKLKPIQKIFYDDLKKTAVNPCLDSVHWNYDIQYAYVHCDNLQVLDSTGTPHTAQNRYLFVLSKLLDALEGKSCYSGYIIRNMNYFFASPNDDNIPCFFKGLSYDVGDSSFYVCRYTFLSGEIKWYDIFKIISVVWNCFIEATPIIENNIIKMDIDLIPRVNLQGATPIDNVKFLERKRIYNKYRIYGIDIQCNNFNYKYGDVDYLEKQLPVSSNQSNADDYANTFYFAEADYVPGNGHYDNPANYIKSANVDVFYDKMINNGDGYTAKVKAKYLSGSEYKYLKILKTISFGSIVILITKLKIDHEDNAKIDCIEIN